MANRVEAVLSGVGTLAQVAFEHVREPNTPEGIKRSLSTLLDVVESLNTQLGTKQAVLACACSLLNEQFERTGYLLSVNQSGRLNITFVACDSDRRVLLQLMAD